MIYSETPEAYRARQAVSAGFLWQMLPPSGCPALAYARSIFSPNPLPQKQAREFDVGTAAHLAVLESHEFAARCSLIAFPDYRKKEAQELRDQCYIDGKIPLLRDDYALIERLRHTLEDSPAAELLFGEGKSEVSYTWSLSEASPDDPLGQLKVDCKARADRVTPHAIVDLKTAASASPEAFGRAMIRDGHHLRAAWYFDGWMENAKIGPYPRVAALDYFYVVIAKEPPNLVEIYRIDERSVAWGRALYEKALREFRRARKSGVWPGYARDGRINIAQLPAWAENMLIARERAGEFDHDDEDIPY